MPFGFIHRLGITEERISELEGMTIETSKVEKQREKRQKKMNRISKACGTTTKDMHNENTRRKRKRERNRAIFEAIIIETLPNSF